MSSPQPPDRFGPYEVVALLGAGGMGQVYRARDPRLNRQVAIKVLARAGADPSRQRRLLDEAQAASALNHPNIITVYDVGTHDGTSYIVSELVEGSSLREALRRAPLGIREVLDLAVQMADGLAAAHQSGIVHRDFKPENVMVTRDGRVKIVDFGLAVVGTHDGESIAEADMTLTIAGTIVGTVPYMSPEQARGATVDYRSDQFSLGLTLYEMVTGRRAFGAATAAQTLAAILDDEPEPIGKLNPRVPAPVRWAIERCLTKDPRQRYDSTADLTRDLRTLRDRLSEFAPASDVVLPVPRRRGRRRLAIAAMISSAAAAGVLVGVASRGGADGTLDRYRFTPIATDAGYQASPSWSPDGKTLAYVAGVNGVLQVFTKAPGSSTRAQVTRRRFDCRDPFWSPDGTRLYFISLARDREGLYSISAAGGDVDLVMEDVYRADISPDGKTLAFFRDRGVGGLDLFLASPIDSEPKPYTKGPFGRGAGYVEANLHFSPDGTKLGVWVERGEGSVLRAEFWILPAGGEAPYLIAAPSDVVGVAPRFAWLPDSRRVVSALPVPSPGTHIWLSDTKSPARRLLTSTGGVESDPAVSPDGGRLALTFQHMDYDIYQLSTDNPTPTAVLATSRSEMDPAWSPTGTEMAFSTDRSGRTEIWIRSRDGDERPVVTAADFAAGSTYLLSSPAFSPDGERIAYNHAGPEGMQIWISPKAGGRPIQLAQGGITQDWPSWSPDGTTIAFAHAVGGNWSLAKARVGGETPEILVKRIVEFSPIQWGPGDSGWIAFNGTEGLSIVSPDGKKTRVLHEQAWMAFAWSADGLRLFGIRLSDDYQHLTFTSVDVQSGAERIVNRDFRPLPVSARLVRGMTRTSATTFMASLVDVRSDVWLLEGFLPSPTLWDRLASMWPLRRR
jgi:serine/threonine protein kinase/Tol biopolymer transport system component